MRTALVVVFVLTAIVIASRTARVFAEYAVGMERGRIEVRHATWDAAAQCRPAFPVELGASIELTITLDALGRTRSVSGEPSVRAFERCVSRRLRRQRLRPTGEDRGHRWTVITRYVFAP